MSTIVMVRKAPPDDYIFDVLMPDLVGHDKAPSAFMVFLKLWHATGGPNRRGVGLSLATLAADTGLSKSSVQSALRRLQARGYVEIWREAATSVPVYTVFAPWRH
jgi:IclR helix-turn-helix domain